MDHIDLLHKNAIIIPLIPKCLNPLSKLIVDHCLAMLLHTGHESSNDIPFTPEITLVRVRRGCLGVP